MTVKEITEIINNIKPKSSSGVDELSNKVIKHIQEIIAEPLTIIINQMLYKLYHYSKFSNYRPIFLLPSAFNIENI